MPRNELTSDSQDLREHWLLLLAQCMEEPAARMYREFNRRMFEAIATTPITPVVSTARMPRDPNASWMDA